MKYKKIISLLVILIAVLSIAASMSGLIMSKEHGAHDFKTVYGDTISIYGKGLYWADSVSLAAQAKAQDVVTVITVPLLMISLYLSRKGCLKGKLLLTGTIGYFLYTYTSYVFVIMFNPMFLIYVSLMSLSFFAFVLTLVSFDLNDLSSSFNATLPVRFIGGFLIFFAIVIGLMWLGIILPPLIDGSIPSELEQYTSLGIQAMDLGFVLPAAILAGILLIRRSSFGYLLSSVIIIKIIAMLSAVIAMSIGMALAGVKVGFVEVMIFLIFDLIAICCLNLIMRNLKEA